jgi:hypothetical protein
MIANCCSVVLLQGQAEAIDGAQGRTQIVRNGIAECFQLAVDALQFRSTHTHTVFERFIQQADLGRSRLRLLLRERESLTGNLRCNA